MFGLIKHVLIPHRNNNHRAKLLHNSSLIALVAIVLFASFFGLAIKKANPEVLGISYSISQGELVNLVNQQRAANGLSALSENAALDDAARRKAADMLAKNYWAHFAPDGSTSPWTFIKDAGYSYTYAGENLAKGFTDPTSVVNAWMNSPTHRDNLLSSKYNDVGFAIVTGNLEGEETVLIVQMFGSKNAESTANVSPAQEAEPVAVISITPTPVSAQVAAAQEIIVITPTLTPTPSPVHEVASSKPLIDSASTAKTAATAGLVFLVFILIMDLIIVEKKKIPRLVGHNIDHIIIICLFIIFVVLSAGGVIL